LEARSCSKQYKIPFFTTVNTLRAPSKDLSVDTVYAH